MESEDYCMNPKPNIVNLPVYKPETYRRSQEGAWLK